ncbi:MAG: cytochrome-c peroxidase [Saprospiraceae bacterium]
MKNLNNLLVFLMVLFFFTSCKKDKIDISYERYTADDYEVLSQTLNIENDLEDYTFVFPKYYNSRSLSFDSDLATLGRVMFYDKNLSDDRTISCASCHKQELAFADDLAFSEGVSNRVTSRNSLALGSVFNFAEYYGDAASGRIPFFWDNRASTVQEQSRQTFANEREMNMPMHKVMERVEAADYYKILFKETYGDSQVTEDRILDAVSEFVNSMSSYRSKYDQELDKHYEMSYNLNNIEGANFSGFTTAENLGKDLYVSNCGNCHGAINGFPAEVKANNGLDMEYEDQGIGEMSGASQNGVFKVPTLRNIALTGPFMHDGRFVTLEEVVDHYSNGVKNHPNLSQQLKQGGQAKAFNFTQGEKDALIAFLNTFTDEVMLTDPKYSDPFK